MSIINAAKEIERLIKFGIQHNMMEDLDAIPVRNALMDLLQVKEPYDGEIQEEKMDSPMSILDSILDYAAGIGLIPENTVTYRDLMDAKIMGLLMPRQSEVVRNFWHTAKNKGIEKATDDFYVLSQTSNYIRMDRIAKNLYWKAKTQYGDLEITINLSKPEKDPKEIAAAKSIPQSNYPKCLLCVENVGFAGTLNHPARQNHRVIPLILNEEQWYFQYSPYVYYNEHCIVFHSQHVPMSISEKTFKRLFDFVDQFPHYFIGSNADLPIVGGSILTHEHFQGGRHIFPMEVASVDRSFTHPHFPDVKVGIVKWPMSVIRLSCTDKNKLIELSKDILAVWRQYSDESVDILSHSKKGDELIPHNTITPIVRKNKDGEFEIDLVLRNNRTTQEYPDGIFHPHRELHHVKKENIGLIEVMGLAVLPGRLNDELKYIEDILTSKVEYHRENYGEGHPINKHLSWIEDMIKNKGVDLTEEEAKYYLREQVGQKFMKVLSDAGVYKDDEKGRGAFDKFMSSLGFVLKK